MTEREELQAEVARAKSALSHRAHMLEVRVETRVKETKARVDHMLDIRGHYRERPWAFVASALAAGVLTGWRRPRLAASSAR